MKARITLISPLSPDVNPLSPDYDPVLDNHREEKVITIEVESLQEARECYQQAVVLDFPSVRGLLLRSIEEVPNV